VVARRILDSLTPGWQQIGAVWLPLPHLLNMLPVQLDACYRTGASGIALSVVAVALAAGSLASMLLRITGSLTAAIAGSALMILNPNILYLQSTPMTEPLLFGLTLLAIAATASWIDEGAAGHPIVAGLSFAAACLTRYEAWAVTAAAIGIAAVVLLRRDTPRLSVLRAAYLLAVWPALAIFVFTLNSRWVVGEWFVGTDFFVPENVEAISNPTVAWGQIDESLRALSGSMLVWAGYGGAALVVVDGMRSRVRASLLLMLALAATVALPMAAYLQGHPVRVRYGLPLVTAAAALSAAGVSVLPKQLRVIAAILLVALTAYQAAPFDRDAPLIRESQREAGAMEGRRTVSEYLRHHYDGATIMMSMGSLGHYMHDLSSIGLDLEDFLHEGNGKPWEFAMLGPAGRAGWLIIEEQAEGGDALFLAAKRDRWLNGFERVAEGGGVGLYRATK
jgi:hypothetical protein